MEFNQAQLQAINHFQGPCLTLAGPGSGKTTVLTYRIQNLIEKHGVRPENILVITFTKMAAKEMEERFLNLSEKRYKSVTFGTFHGVYFTILKHAYHYQAGNIITQQEQYRFLKNILGDYELEITDYTEFVKNVLALIGRLKISGIQPDDDSVLHGELCPSEVFRDIYRRYQKYLTARRYLDFEDMLVYCYELLSARKDILEQWQEQFQYILIDEFQDICRIQFDIIVLLAKKYRNLFIVGDDDQSIYGFRGACPDYMQEFERIYPDAVRIDLCMNYRSAPEIVHAAKSLIEHNKNRFQKDITAYEREDLSSAAVYGEHLGQEKVLIKEFENTDMENAFIAEKLLEEYEMYHTYHRMAVLVRTNAGAVLLTQHLVSKNIPFIIKEQINNPFEHWIAQDIMAYIMLAMGNRERKTFFRILNKPLRYLGREAFPDSTVDFERLRSYYAEKSWLAKKVDKLQADIAFLSKMRPFAAVNYIRKGIGYDAYLKEYAKEQKADLQEFINRLEEIHQSTRDFFDFAAWFQYIEEYSEKLKEGKQEGQSMEKNQKTDGVWICTMHSAKGLEYDTVFILDVNEGIIPYHKAILDSEIEEERRMFYVAMTRAKKHLYLCCVGERYHKKLEKSRFLKEIDSHYVRKELLCNTPAK